MKIALEILFTLLTLVAYIVGRSLYKKSGWMVLHTIIVATTFIILLFSLFKNDITLYVENSRALRYLLDISVVALGYLLYQNYLYIKERGVAILFATFAGALISLLSVAAIGVLFKIDFEMIVSLLPKSVTSPIAIEVSEQYGGNISLTALYVIAAGIFGALVGPWFLKRVGIVDRMAVGLSLGSAAHGIGTAKALEYGALEGALGGLAIALMALFTSLLAPLIVPLLSL